jgi:hypothetical protein
VPLCPVVVTRRQEITDRFCPFKTRCPISLIGLRPAIGSRRHGRGCMQQGKLLVTSSNFLSPFQGWNPYDLVNFLPFLLRLSFHILFHNKLLCLSINSHNGTLSSTKRSPVNASMSPSQTLPIASQHRKCPRDKSIGA